MQRLTSRASTVKGTIRAPPSKSVTHRAILLAHLAGAGMVRNALLAADTRATVNAAKVLGSRVVATKDEITVQRGDFKGGEIDALNSGTTLRLATALAALAPGVSKLTGDASLQRRPIRDLVEALGQLGVQATCTASGTPPVEIKGPMTRDTCHVNAEKSGQFVSALLLLGTQAPHDLHIRVETIASKPYVDLTLQMIRDAGGRVRSYKNKYHVLPGLAVTVDFTVPGDYSSAAFPLVAAALTGEVTVTGLPMRSYQADEVILDVLQRVGATVKRDGDSVTVARGTLQAFEADLGKNPDIFPVLCVLASQCEGTTRLFGAPQLRHKESDRIQATTDLLRTLGGRITPTQDGALVEGPTKLRGGEVASLEDHRIQMAAAVAGFVASGPVTVDGGDAYAVSFPDFPEAMRRLGAEVTAA